MTLRKLHRYIAVFAVFIAFYVGLSGVILQLTDLHSLLAHVPATDPNLQALREGSSGPPNFQVIADSDYTAEPLPPDLSVEALMSTVVVTARSTVAGDPISFVELRMMAGKPIGNVDSNGRLLRIDAQDGQVLVGPGDGSLVKLPAGGGRPSFRNTIKNLHRMTAYGDYATPVFVLCALAMCGMVVTGLWMYFRLLSSRNRIGRRGLFWRAGGWWLSLHRAISIAASIFLLVVVFSGTFLAFGSLGVSYYRVSHHGHREGLTADVSRPLQDAEIAAMLRTTFAAFRQASPNTPVKVVRLRYFADMPQGVIVAGSDADTEQLAFNAATGRRASLSDTGYPVTGQPFGWQADQIVKHIHRGDAFGLTGRWISLLTGLSLLFLATSGTVVYFNAWRRRRHSNRHGLFWSP